MAAKRSKKAKVRKARPGVVKVVNPSTGKVFETFPITTKEQVDAKVEKAREAFRSWSHLDIDERAAYLQHFAEMLRKHKEDYAKTMTMEMGKIIRESLAEVEKCATAADYFAQSAKGFLGRHKQRLLDAKDVATSQIQEIDASLDLLELEAIGRRFGPRFACGEHPRPEQGRDRSDPERSAHHLAAVVTPQDDVADHLAMVRAARNVVMGLAGCGPVAELVSIRHMRCEDDCWGSGRVGPGYDRFLTR